LGNIDDFKRMFFAFICLNYLMKIKDDKDWGYGIKYKRMAIIAAVGVRNIEEEITAENVNSLAREKIDAVKMKWKLFEEWTQQQEKNKMYFDGEAFDYDKYYKGGELNSDIHTFFRNN